MKRICFISINSTKAAIRQAHELQGGLVCKVYTAAVSFRSHNSQL